MTTIEDMIDRAIAEVREEIGEAWGPEETYREARERVRVNPDRYETEGRTKP